MAHSENATMADRARSLTTNPLVRRAAPLVVLVAIGAAAGLDVALAAGAVATGVAAAAALLLSFLTVTSAEARR